MHKHVVLLASGWFSDIAARERGYDPASRPGIPVRTFPRSPLPLRSLAEPFAAAPAHIESHLGRPRVALEPAYFHPGIETVER